MLLLSFFYGKWNRRLTIREEAEGFIKGVSIPIKIEDSRNPIS